MKSNKGVYSILSSFMFIVIMVAVLLALIYTSFITSANESVLLGEIRPFYESIDAKDSIVNCITPLTEKRLDEESQNLSCLEKIPSLKGYSLRQLEFFECSEKTWRIGITQNCSKELFFLINKDEKEKLNCLSMLTLCFK